MNKQKYILIVEDEDGEVRFHEYRQFGRAVEAYKRSSTYASLAVRLVQVICDYGEKI